MLIYTNAHKAKTEGVIQNNYDENQRTRNKNSYLCKLTL